MKEIKILDQLAGLMCLAVFVYVVLSALTFFSGTEGILALFDRYGDKPFHSVLLLVIGMLVFSDSRRKSLTSSWKRIAVTIGVSAAVLAMNYWVHLR